mmetsp:Transcript_56974/g.158646  ORF Transcript_56974/g.158646 Transcript_56974/m.158646 type:complete len:246 (+) Transcript_56974:115-852(+)
MKVELKRARLTRGDTAFSLSPASAGPRRRLRAARRRPRNSASSKSNGSSNTATRFLKSTKPCPYKSAAAKSDAATSSLSPTFSAARWKSGKRKKPVPSMSIQRNKSRAPKVLAVSRQVAMAASSMRNMRGQAARLARASLKPRRKGDQRPNSAGVAAALAALHAWDPSTIHWERKISCAEGLFVSQGANMSATSEVAAAGAHQGFSSVFRRPGFLSISMSRKSKPLSILSRTPPLLSIIHATVES